MLKLINLIPNLHLVPSDEELEAGLDASIHGEQAYIHDIGATERSAALEYAGGGAKTLPAGTATGEVELTPSGSPAVV